LSGHRRRAARALAGAALTLALLLAGGPLRAGSVEGPYLVWVNLAIADGRHAAHAADQAEGADAQIRAFVNGAQRLCWPDGALLYMRERPAGITTALVRQALEARDPAAQQRLRTLLRRPFGEVPGFDGLVAFSNRPVPRLIGLPMAGRLRAEPLRSATGEDAWGASFCRVMPPISRRP